MEHVLVVFFVHKSKEKLQSSRTPVAKMTTATVSHATTDHATGTAHAPTGVPHEAMIG